MSQCTIHGPITSGIDVNNGARNIHILDCNFLPLGDVSATAGKAAILLGTGQSNFVRGCDGYDFETGVQVNGANCDISHNSFTGGSVGISAAVLAADNRIIGNHVGFRPVGGGNTIGILLQSGSTRHLVVGNFAFGAATPINDASGAGNHVIANNLIA